MTDLAFIYDTETTGLISNRLRKNSHQAEVIEFYGCLIDLDTAEVKAEYETLIKPREYPIKEETIKETKMMLNNEMLANAPPFADVAETIRGHIEKAPMVIAHNAAFDREILDIEMDRLGKHIFWPPMLCTIEQTMHLKGFRLSLTELHKHLFKSEFLGAHRAKNDVTALAKCCVELKKKGAI